MQISPNLSVIVLFYVFTFFLTFDAARVQKASKLRLNHIKSLINEEAEREYAAIQNDGVDLFADIVRDNNAVRNEDELTVNDPEEYFQGDVDLSEQQVSEIEKELTPGTREKRKIGKTPLYHLWDRNSPISFDFADSIPKSTRSKIRDAIRLWQRHTCLRFEEGGPSVDRIEFFDGGGCSSFVGRVGGTQGISIASPGCDVIGIISHEIGHALGNFHEQARPDQDRYISVNYNNIPIGRWNNFQPVSRSQAETYDLPYDTGSVMHYGPYGFASDPYIPTIRTLERGHQTTIGQRAGPSFLDFAAINAAYGCNDICASIPCLRNGYPHPNNCSTCMCPDGFKGQFCGEIRESNAQCGGVIYVNKTPQYITSPNFPYFFSRNDECYWLLMGPPGGRVYMEFVEKFEFYCQDTCDKSYVEIKYNSDKRLTGARYCCSTIPKPQFISFDNEMIVIMRGFGGASAGFRAKFWSDKGDPLPETTTASVPPPPERFIPYPSRVVPRIRTTTEPTTTIKEVTRTIPPTTTTVRTTTEPPPPPSSISLQKTTQPTVRPWIRPTPPIAPPVLIPGVPAITQPPPIIPSVKLTTDTPDVISSGAECSCGPWSEWIGECSQECGACGTRTRTRTCKKEGCRKEDKRRCNFGACPHGTNFLINNQEFHILLRGCCIGMFRSGEECTALETNQNPFLSIINSLLSIQDQKKRNATDQLDRNGVGEH